LTNQIYRSCLNIIKEVLSEAKEKVNIARPKDEKYPYRYLLVNKSHPTMELLKYERNSNTDIITPYHYDNLYA